MHSNASARMPTSTTFNLEIQEPPANDQLTTTSSHYESNRARFRNQNLDKKGCALCAAPRGPNQIVRNDRLCTYFNFTQVLSLYSNDRRYCFMSKHPTVFY